MEIDRTEKVRACRPKLALKYDALNATEDLIFQNEVLRPLLKFQNSLILGSYLDYCLARKINIGQLNEEQLKATVKNALAKDQKLKNQIIGMVIGLFTEEEFKYYQQHQKDLNKRIITMTLERIVSQL